MLICMRFKDEVQMVEHDSWKDYTLNVMNVRLIGDDFLKSNPTFVWLCQQLQENVTSYTQCQI